MIFKTFSLLLSLRVGVLMLLIGLLGWFLMTPGYQANTVLVSLLLVALLVETLKFINKTNNELVRFLDTIRHGELNQRFDYSGYGSGFEQLGQAFSAIMGEVQQKNKSQEQTLRHIQSLLEQVPVPLISLHSDHSITQWNHSARRLFGHYQVQKLQDLSRFGEALPHQLTQLSAGEHQLVSFEVDGMSQQLALSATLVSVAGKQEKLISLQDIRNQLDMAQLQAWQELVRVLTHEIMNSITPVASLADTASELVRDIQQNHHLSTELEEELSDVQSAVKTLSKRSHSLMKFVNSYRRLSRLPTPNFSQINPSELFTQVSHINAQTHNHHPIKITIQTEPADLGLQADRDMLEQVLINLLQNATQAMEHTQDPQITLRAFLNRRNHVVMEISDSGPGIEDHIIQQVFVPFFTTKKQGSGVGLALTQQVMIAHGGNVKVENQPQGGACFTLTF